ncbi:MAG: hypothetical protein H7Z74_17455, partial [Anaerolineae bacterium]|nr:hypothetical protein [Gemmatimonadaceae bacterium]
MTETLTLPPKLRAGKIELRNAGDGRLLAIVNGEPVAVRLRQCFPWSEPG